MSLNSANVKEEEYISIDEAAQQIDDSKKYWTFEPAQVRKGRFDSQKVKPVLNTFTGEKDRYSFNVLDLDRQLPKEWVVSKTTFSKIKKELDQGRNVLQIQRRGEGKQTEYVVVSSEEDQS